MGDNRSTSSGQISNDWPTSSGQMELLSLTYPVTDCVRLPYRPRYRPYKSLLIKSANSNIHNDGGEADGDSFEGSKIELSNASRSIKPIGNLTEMEIGRDSQSNDSDYPSRSSPDVGSIADNQSGNFGQGYRQGTYV